MPAVFDQDLTDRANAILRRGDPRLLAAAGLIGKIAVLYNPTKPPKPAADPKPKGKGRKAPPRVDDPRSASELRAEAEASGEVSAPPPGPAKIPAPWHKIAVPARASEVALNGERYLAKITIDGGTWDELGERSREVALFLALRALRFKEGEGDAADGAEVEKPPVRAWPDCAGEAGEIMAAMVDGEQGAALAAALRTGDPAEDLAEALDAVGRLLAAGNDRAPASTALYRAAGRLRGLAEQAEELEAAKAAAAIEALTARKTAGEPRAVGGEG